MFDDCSLEIPEQLPKDFILQNEFQPFFLLGKRFNWFTAEKRRLSALRSDSLSLTHSLIHQRSFTASLVIIGLLVFKYGPGAMCSPFSYSIRP